MADVVMPQLGETVTEGTITRWFKQPGESVAADEVLFEVSTDKVDSEVPSPAAGVLTEIRVPEGETVDVGTVLAVISADGEAAASASPASEVTASAPPPEAATPEPAAAPQPPAPAPEPPAPAEPEAPPAAQPATPFAAAPEPPPAPPEAPASSAGDTDNSMLLSPVVRRLIAEHDLDPAGIEGTGVGGRITRADVERLIQSRAAAPPSPAPPSPATPAPAPAPAPAAQPAPAPAPAPADQPASASAPAPRPARTPGERDTVVPFNNIRRLTGEYMVASKATSPHVLTAVEVDFEGVEKVRRAHRSEWKEREGFSLTYLPFIARAVCDAIHDYPHVNASVGNDELIVHNYVNLAIAVDLDFQGLLAPVIADADSKRLRAISREVVDLAERARTRKLTADEVTGGTFTITNPGQYGTMMQFPIINQPQVAILSTDGIRRKPVVVTDAAGNEAIAIHSVGILALAWDHRAFDGAYVAAFLDHLRTIIETRDWEAEVQ